MIRANLEEIVRDLSVHVGSDALVSDTVLGLKGRYDEPWRRYHTFEHVREMFGTLGQHRDLVRNLGTVGWAIMFHDAVYDPKAEHGRNEELSAQLAEFRLTSLMGETGARKVARYTRATVHHEAGEEDSDLDFFLDSDLVILGADPERYDRYAHDVYDEYVTVAGVPEEHYRLGRAAILGGLASRAESGGLFRVPELGEAYEAQAQENIAREIERLNSDAPL